MLTSYWLGALKFRFGVADSISIVSSAVDMIEEGSRRYHAASKIEDFGRYLNQFGKTIEYQQNTWVKVQLAYLIHDAASRVF